MDWFRFYNETKDDLKLRRIARETGQSFASVVGIWALLLCIASESPERGALLIAEGIPATEEDIADLAGCNVTVTLQKLHDFGMLEDDHGVMRLTHWEKRQYDSDDSATRVRRHRERQKQARNDPVNAPTEAADAQCNGDVTLHGRYDAVTVTPPDTDTDTELNIPPPGAAACSQQFSRELSMFADRIHLVANQMQAQEMIDRLERLREAGCLGWWDMALKVAEDNNARRWSYVRGILDRCLREGRPPGAPKIAGGNGHETGRSDRGRDAVDIEYRRLNTPERIAALRAEWDREDGA